jgi:tetratricopeptide (TPR) repeat protein
MLCNLRLDLKKTAEAESCLTELGKLYQQLPLAVHGMAQLRQLQGRLEEAEALFKKAAEQFPDDGETQHNYRAFMHSQSSKGKGKGKGKEQKPKKQSAKKVLVERVMAFLQKHAPPEKATLAHAKGAIKHYGNQALLADALEKKYGQPF